MTAAEAIANSEVVIFDLYHTLVSFKSDATPGRDTSSILGIPEESWKTLLWEHSEDRLKNNQLDDISSIRQLAHMHDPSIPEAVIVDAATERAGRFGRCLTNPPAHRVDSIRRLSENGKKLILLSNADSMERRAWEKSPFAPFFEAALFSCDIGYVKPQPEAYRKALDVFNTQPSKAIFVGDGGSNELRGAKQCGISTIMATGIVGKLWPEKLPPLKAHADYIIDSLDELLG